MSEEEDITCTDQLDELVKHAFEECLTNQYLYGIFCLNNEETESNE